MRILLSILLSGLLFTACGPDRIEEFEGTLSEAQFNALTLIGEQGHPVTFRTEEAEFEHADELATGCRVKVLYRGRIREGSATAVRVEVDPTCARLLGRWIEAEDGMGMGIEFEANGTARSIGMQTLIFTGWEQLPGNGLKLSGYSIGNGSTITFSEEWEIQELDPDRLTIAQSDLTLRFRRETEEDALAREEREAAAAQPQKR